MKWIRRGKESSIEQVFLRNIGARSLDDINKWFKKSIEGEYGIKDLGRAVKYARYYKEKTVTIVGDYDADGVTSTSILYLALRQAGFKDVRYRIPRRFSEGFGINPVIIDEIESGLVITCDNGVAQPEAIAKAKKKGLDVIIIDHHEPIRDESGNAILPDADVIIDPNAIEGSADFTAYCGAGLCYKFAETLLGDRKACRKYLSLAAIGTVADVVELREENYVFVRQGLKTLINAPFCTAGLYALISTLNLNKNISAKDIGFKIAPCINAASRMQDEGATKAVELLTYEGGYPKAVAMAEALVALNEERKELKKKGMEMAHRVITDECLYGDIPLVVYVPDVKEGIIGILAGALCEEFKTPSIVLTDAETKGVLKGSARSLGDYDMKEALDKCSDYLVAHGGHKGAAGLSLKAECLDALREALRETAEGFSFDMSSDIYYDLEIEAKDIPSTIEDLAKYAPFGAGNPEIVFKIDGFSCMPKYGAYKKLIGADKNIVKLQSAQASAIGFNSAEKMAKVEPRKLNLVGSLSNNYFGGNVEAQVEFSDFETVETEMVETPLAAKLKMMASK